MSIRYIPISSREAWGGIEGYPGVDIIEITYSFPNGIQVFINIYGDLRLQIMHKLSALCAILVLVF